MTSTGTVLKPIAQTIENIRIVLCILNGEYLLLLPSTVSKKNGTQDEFMMHVSYEL